MTGEASATTDCSLFRTLLLSVGVLFGDVTTNASVDVTDATANKADRAKGWIFMACISCCLPKKRMIGSTCNRTGVLQSSAEMKMMIVNINIVEYARLRWLSSVLIPKDLACCTD